jgi:nucleoside-diphosphate-sugar epimerase
LISRFREKGFTNLRSVDIKPFNEWYQCFDDVENLQLDLKDKDACTKASDGAAEIYNLAADMGGMGFIENNKALCMLSVLISTHMLMAATDADVVALREEDAYPADAEDGYGWEKLFTERMCRHYREDYGLTTRVARFHNVYGPFGTWEGGREKAPAAICRKVIKAKLSGGNEIEIWGDGLQTRSFMYVDDCTQGIDMLTHSDVVEPLNLGSSELVSINQLVDYAEEIAGVKLQRNYKLDAPKGVRGRNSDNTKIQQCLGWEPGISLRDGLEKTYAWIHDEYVAKYGS